MQITVVHEAAFARPAVVLHAWESGGRVWDIEATPDAQGRFTFLLEGDVPDPRQVTFKYRYPREATTEWEDDAFERRVPLTTPNQTILTFDFTARCLVGDPTAPQPAPPNEVVLHVITRSRFAGGDVFVWNPGGSESERFREAARDAGTLTSTFRLPLRTWMQGGFHFKLARDRDFEPDRSNRVWRPIDGSTLFLKSGQISLREQPLALEAVMAQVLYPRGLGAPPLLLLNDLIEPFEEEMRVTASAPLGGNDPDLMVAEYSGEIYPNALYLVRSRVPAGIDGIVRVWQGDVLPRAPFTAVLGTEGVRQTPLPQRNADVTIRVHPNPASRFAGDLALDVRLGPAPSDARAPARIPYTRIAAPRDAASGEWRARFNVLGDMPQSFSVADPSGGFAEGRPDGRVQGGRTIVPPANVNTIYHTADGVAGVSLTGSPAFSDVPQAQRQALMTAAFGNAATAGNVFAPEEMPHGATTVRGLGADTDGVWFVLRAPYAMAVELVLLQPGGGPGTAIFHPMSLTADLRYWWCRLPPADAPHGRPYRFRINGVDGVEVLDPASRWARDPGYLSVGKDDRASVNASGPASLVVDGDVLAGLFAGSSWRTMGWEALLVYEMHPLRFTRRNRDAGGSVLPAFAQIVEELKPGKYLDKLPVSALELMPVHEFPRDQSWGYNPSLFFAADSFYGGPEGLARCVRAAHDAGKAVLLDLVYNHMTDSPLQTIAPDVYTDGETAWGAMLNYDHPAAFEFFRQATISVWRTFRIDGFRFDATEAIINGDKPNPYIIKRNPDGSYATGSGGGWEFLDGLRTALRRAADAAGMPWPYLAGENDPNNWGMTDGRKPGVLDGQWHFGHHYPLGDAAENDGSDRAGEIAREMRYPHLELRPYFETVRYGESHDSVSSQGGKFRIAQRAPFGQGWQMAKAVAAAALLPMGIPMLFMGAEAGEDVPFAFDLDQLSEPLRYLRLDAYEDLGDGRNRVWAWCRDLMGLRNDTAKGLGGNDDQRAATGRRTVAFVRGGGRLFVTVTFGTPDRRQDSGWLGLPGGGAYKEIFNSSWPAYQVEGEQEASNGGHDARIRSGQLLNLPYIGAIVLEKV